MKRLRAAAAAALLLVPPAFAATRAAWDGFSPERREAVLAGWRRFRAMPPVTQALLRQRYAAFRRLPPDGRARVQSRFRWLRTLSPERLAGLRAGLKGTAPSRQGARAPRGVEGGERSRERAEHERGPSRERGGPAAAHHGGRR